MSRRRVRAILRKELQTYRRNRSIVVGMGIIPLVFLAQPLVSVFAQAGVASALLRAPDVVAQVVFTPLVAGWSIWLGSAISTRAPEVRVAQQLGVLASLPTIAVTTLVAISVIPATPTVAITFGVGLMAGNWVGWRAVSALFERERLVATLR